MLNRKELESQWCWERWQTGRQESGDILFCQLSSEATLPSRNSCIVCCSLQKSNRKCSAGKHDWQTSSSQISPNIPHRYHSTQPVNESHTSITSDDSNSPTATFTMPKYAYNPPTTNATPNASPNGASSSSTLSPPT